MKLVILLGLLTATAQAADATHTCYARFGSPDSELATPCEKDLELNLSAVNLKEIEILSDQFQCGDKVLHLSFSVQGKDSFRVNLSDGRHANWTIYDLADHKLIWLGTSSPEMGFAEVSCIAK